MRALTILFGFICVCSCVFAKQALQKNRDERLFALARTDMKGFAHEVTKGATSELGETQAIVHWLIQNFEWKTTDYQRRTVPEIIERGGGNCDDFSRVALAAMTELGIQSRRVHEVHVRTESPERGERARTLVKEKGDVCSVFGRHHNDHVWLEVYDSSTREWFPADPWNGLVGTDDWMKGRVWFGKRKALSPDARDMMVPFAIFAADANGNFTIDRTRHYLVEEFDRLYDGKLHQEASWPQWVQQIDFLSKKVEGAFAGKVNLLEYEPQIDSLAVTYDKLRAELPDQNPPS
jgi:hypothetical protein